jgi:uncharacterized membrane protein
VLPLVVLATSLIFDVAYLTTGRPRFAEIAFWVILIGVVGGIAAAVWDVFESFSIPSCRRSKNVDLWHGLVNAAVTLLFIASWVVRRPNPGAPGRGAIVLSVVGVAAIVLMSWLGDDLAEHLDTRRSRRGGGGLQPRSPRA